MAQELLGNYDWIKFHVADRDMDAFQGSAPCLAHENEQPILFPNKSLTTSEHRLS